MDKIELTEWIKKRAFDLNCSACGITIVKDNSQEMAQLNNWILQGYHAEMQWINNNKNLRENPELLYPEVKSIVVITVNYFSNDSVDPYNYSVSKYAQNIDYHFVLKSKLSNILISLQDIDGTIEGRFFVDSGPFFEKSYAVHAGIGWIGKNSLLIIPNKGSFHFIGVLLLNKELIYDFPYSQDHCGDCVNCLVACPTKALVKPRILDARKCISYLTVEHKGEIPYDCNFGESNSIFGCDICQLACPQNRFMTQSTEDGLIPSSYMKAMNKTEWEGITKSEFKKIFKHSSLQRAGYEKIKANIEHIKKSNH